MSKHAYILHICHITRYLRKYVNIQFYIFCPHSSKWLALPTEVRSVNGKDDWVEGSDGNVDLSRLGSTFSAVLIHALMAAALAAAAAAPPPPPAAVAPPSLPPQLSRSGSGAGAGKAKDCCLLMGESGFKPALPPPDRGPVGMVGVAKPPP